MTKQKSPNFISRHPFYRNTLYISSAVILLSYVIYFFVDLPYFLSLVGFGIGIFILLLGVNSLIADLAKTKGRSWAAFFWLSILFSPLIMWIIAATISSLPGSSAYIAPSTSPTASVSSDIAKVIEKLGSLKEQGLITKAEFEAKKKELLDRI